MDVEPVRQPFFEPILRAPDARPSMPPVKYIPLHQSLAPDHVPDTLERLLEDSLAFGPPLPAAPASGDSLLEDTLLEDTPVVGPPAVRRIYDPTCAGLHADTVGYSEPRRW